MFFLSIVALMTWYRFAVNRNFGLDLTGQHDGSPGQGDERRRSSARRLGNGFILCKFITVGVSVELFGV